MSATDRAFIKAYGGANLRSDVHSEGGDAPPLNAAGELPAQATRPPAERAYQFDNPQPAPPPPHISMDGAQTFDPVLKVERFLWPEVCNRLNSRIPQRLDEAAKRLAGVPGSKGRVIGLAGCRRGVGCTTALLCLARRLMGMQISPVLVEGDFLQPALAARLGVHVPTGWDDVLRGHLSLAEAMVFSREDHLALLPLKRAVSDSRKLAGSPILQGCLRVLRQHFPLVLVDLGSVLSPSDSSTTVGLCSFSGLESTLLVCSEMDLASNGWRPALNQLRDESLHPAGIIETFATSHGADF